MVTVYPSAPPNSLTPIYGYYINASCLVPHSNPSSIYILLSLHFVLQSHACSLFSCLMFWRRRNLYSIICGFKASISLVYPEIARLSISTIVTDRAYACQWHQNFEITPSHNLELPNCSLPYKDKSMTDTSLSCETWPTLASISYTSCTNDCIFKGSASINCYCSIILTLPNMVCQWVVHCDVTCHALCFPKDCEVFRKHKRECVGENHL